MARGASKNASNSVKEDAQNDALTKPVTRRNTKVNKENDPAAKVKNTRKGSVQPLHEKNSVSKAEKENKLTASVGTAETDQLSSKSKIDSTKVTKRSKATKVHDNGKRIRLNEKIVEMPTSKSTNRRGESAARKQPDLLVATNESGSAIEKQQKTTLPTPDVRTPTKPVVIPSIKTRSKAPEITTRPRRGGNQKLPETTSFASPKAKRTRGGNKQKTAKSTPALVSPARNINKPTVIGTPQKSVVSSTKMETTVPDFSAFASPKTTRPRLNKQKKTAKSTPAIVSPVRNINKPTAIGTPQKSVVVSSTKISAFASPKTTRPRRVRQQKVTEPIPKAVPTSNVTVRRKGGNNPDVDIEATSNDKNVPGVSNPFVTTRKRGRNLETTKTGASETLKSEEPVISNITKRRKDKTAMSSSVLDEMEMDKVTGGVTRRKRLRSVNATKLKEADVSQIDTIATPPRKGNGTKNKVAKTKQLELSVDCNVAGDVSDQSNGSTVPVYKRTSNNNSDVIDSVFDFESNSQENTLNKDEQMQEVYAKLVRENRASVIKPKRKGKKGVTKSKTTVAPSKRTIEKIRSELKDLKQHKELSVKVTTRKVTTSKAIPKQPEKTLFNESELALPSGADIVELADEEIDMVIPSETGMGIQSDDNMGIQSDDDKRNPSANDMTILSGDPKKTENKKSSKQQIVSGASTNCNVNKESPRQNLLPDNTTTTVVNKETSTHTPTNVKTYPSPKKVNPIFQSTPVHKAKPNDACPWRVPTLQEIKYSTDVFARYTTFEKSPIMRSETSKIPPRQETIEPNKNVHQPVQTQEVKDNLQKIEKATDLTSDIKNCFGFDNDDIDDDIPTRPSLPDVNTSFGRTKIKSPKPKNATKPKRSSTWLQIPQSILTIKQTLAKWRNGPTVVAQAADVQGNEKEKTQSKISTHFGGARNVTVRSTRSVQKESIKAAIKKKKIETSSRIQELSGIENITTEVPNLFDTSWPEPPDHKHRSYTRVPKREYKLPYENKTISDDKSVLHSVTQVRSKRTKQRDDNLQEELRKVEEIYNSEFLEVDNFEMIMEKST